MAANRFELLASWYLRFNGFFTTPDFTIHPNFKKQGGGTDADVLAVRFRHSDEFQRRFQFERDPILAPNADVEFLICEVKAGLCAINDAWRDSMSGNVEYAVRWMGFEADANQVALIAKALYGRGLWRSADKRTVIRFVSFGERTDQGLRDAMPEAQCVLHTQVIAYLKHRFTKSCLNITRANWDKAIVEFAGYCEDESITEKQLLDWASNGAIPQREQS